MIVDSVEAKKKCGIQVAGHYKDVVKLEGFHVDKVKC